MFSSLFFRFTRVSHHKIRSQWSSRYRYNDWHSTLCLCVCLSTYDWNEVCVCAISLFHSILWVSIIVMTGPLLSFGQIYDFTWITHTHTCWKVSFMLASEHSSVVYLLTNGHFAGRIEFEAVVDTPAFFPMKKKTPTTTRQHNQNEWISSGLRIVQKDHGRYSVWTIWSAIAIPRRLFADLIVDDAGIVRSRVEKVESIFGGQFLCFMRCSGWR